MRGLSTIFNDYLDYLEASRELSPNTVKVYFYETRMFCRFIKYRFDMLGEDEDINSPDTIDISMIDETILNRVTLRDLYAYIAYVTIGLDNKNAAKARKVSSLRTFFNYLHNKVKVIDENPVLGLDMPKIDKSLPIYLSLEEANLLIDTIRQVEDPYIRMRDLSIILVFLNTGVRISELCGLDLTDYHPDNLSIRVMGKGRKEREIYLHPQTAAILDKYIKVRPKLLNESALFISRKKNRYSSRGIQYMVERYVTKAGLDPNQITVHKLRHTAATFMYRYGDSDLRSIQEILGHANVSTTQIYTHVSEEKKRELLESFPVNEVMKDRNDKNTMS